MTTARQKAAFTAAVKRVDDVMKRIAMPVAVGYYLGRVEARDRNRLGNKIENLKCAFAQAEKHWKGFISLGECFIEPPSPPARRKK